VNTLRIYRGRGWQNGLSDECHRYMREREKKKRGREREIGKRFL
jgi:hypothetical protein